MTTVIPHQFHHDKEEDGPSAQTIRPRHLRRAVRLEIEGLARKGRVDGRRSGREYRSSGRYPLQLGKGTHTTKNFRFSDNRQSSWCEKNLGHSSKRVKNFFGILSKTYLTSFRSFVKIYSVTLSVAETPIIWITSFDRSFALLGVTTYGKRPVFCFILRLASWKDFGRFLSKDARPPPWVLCARGMH